MAKKIVVIIDKSELPKVRKPSVPAVKKFKDKSKYSRKQKHQQKG